MCVFLQACRDKHLNGMYVKREYVRADILPFYVHAIKVFVSTSLEKYTHSPRLCLTNLFFTTKTI